jgi:thiamine biosynthesis lipoprotein
MPAAITTLAALGTTATVVVDDPVAQCDATAVLERELRAIDDACSRFREDSDLARVNAAAGRPVPVSPLCIEAVLVATRAARATDGLVDPTVGTAMRVLGYDRDFAAVAPDGPPLCVRATRVAGWQALVVDAASGTVTVPRGVELDLGATAKALCADRAARAAHELTGAGVLVAIGGDVAIGGTADEPGWPVRVHDDHTATFGGEVIALRAGGIATSGTQRRRWVRGERHLHHVVDPRTGEPADGPWRTVSVAAATCVDANIASTAAIVMGDDALTWLRARRLPARLVAHDGHTTRVSGWPPASAPEVTACS